MADEENDIQKPAGGTAEAASSSGAPQSEPLDAAGISALQEQVIAAIQTCYDPEIPVNIYDLGLIYDVQIDPAAQVNVKMTLTSPACPSAISLPGEVEDKIRVLPGVKDIMVDVVWDPPWDTGKMSEAAKLQLGMM